MEEEIKIKKGLKLRITGILPGDRSIWFEGEIGRVYKDKCHFNFKKTNWKTVYEGRWTLGVKGFNKLLKDKDKNIIVLD